MSKSKSLKKKQETDDPWNYVEPHIVQGYTAPEPVSLKRCEECQRFEDSLTTQPCWDCYPSADRPNWVERKDDGHKDRDSEFEQVDRKDSGDGSPGLQ